jgi:uncharacterized protein YodC (DUF2158 family)
MTHYTSDIKLVVNDREFTHLRGVEYVWSVSICDGKLAFVGSGEVTVDESRLLDLTRMLMDASPDGQFCIRVTHRAPGQEHTDELLACRVVSSPYRCAGNLRKINIHFSMVRFDGHIAFAGMGYCIGSVVYLKSGSPPMTIVAIEKTVGGEEVLTQWFTPSGETTHGRFMVTSLTIHKPLDTKTEQANLSTSSHTWATIGIDGDVVRRIVREELSNATEGKIQAEQILKIVRADLKTTFDRIADDQVDAVRARLYAPPRAQSRLSVVPTDTVRSLVRDELSRLFSGMARES